MMEKRSIHRTPLQINGKCLFAGERDDGASHQCILMDVSPAGAGLIVSSPVPVNRNSRFTVEFALHSRTAQASIDVKWARPLHEISNYNWAAGGEWSAIDNADRQLLMEFAAENYSSVSLQAERLKVLS
jgi:hypothetical protein